MQFLTGAQLADMEEKKEGESKLEGGRSEIFCISLCETDDRQPTHWMKHILPHLIRDLQHAGLKKWSSSQTREFGDLHALIATLILACDTR